MRFAAFVAALGGAAACVTTAFAADPVPVMPAPMPVASAPAPATGYSWQGAYAGAAYMNGVVVSGHIGFNAVRGNLLVGGEAILATGLGGTPYIGFGAGARVGLILGATDAIVLYATGRAIYVPNDGITGLWAMGGVEFGLGTRFSVFAEAGVAGGILPGPVFGCCGFGHRAGINIHFGR